MQPVLAWLKKGSTSLIRIAKKQCFNLVILAWFAWIVFWPSRRQPAAPGVQPFHPTMGFYLAMLALFAGMVVAGVIVCLFIDFLRGGRPKRRPKPRGFEVILAADQPPSAAMADPHSQTSANSPNPVPFHRPDAHD